MDMKFEVYINIQKSIEEVFNAVYDGNKLSQYFTTGGASGPLEAGTTVMWDFADFPGAFPVHAKRTIKFSELAFAWGSAEEGKSDNLVEVFFDKLTDNTTKVRISETGWSDTQQGLKASYGNCMGWSQMLCCLKAYLEYGINLRQGSYGAPLK